MVIDLLSVFCISKYFKRNSFQCQIKKWFASNKKTIR